MTQAHTRRTFLKSAGALGVAPLALGTLVRAASPNSALHHACIGVGGMMGHGDLSNFANHSKVKIVALCDVDGAILSGAGDARPDARRYADWREMFAAEGDKIDSVNVTVPDHMHAPMVMTALRAGKHVYCQKPMCHDVAEVRALTLAAKAAGVRTQLGTQAASTIGSRMTVQMIQEGLIGKIKRVVLRANRGGIEWIRVPGPRPAEAHTPPAHLNWDLWLGTAPVRPYAPGIYHPSVWRSWLDFGTGWSGDIGCHLYHAPWRALALTAPTQVTAKVQQSWLESPERRNDTWPQSNFITWTFPGTDYTEGDTVNVEWHDGEFEPDAEASAVVDNGSYHHESALFIGTEGAILLPNGGGPRIFPHEKFRAAPRPQLPGRHHYHDFVDACFTGETTESDFVDVSGPMSEAVLLGTVALRVPNELHPWDSAQLMFVDRPEAQALVRRQYRAGWEMEGL